MSASERGSREKRGEDASGAGLRRGKATRDERPRSDDLAGALSDSFSRLEQRLEDLASAFDDQPAPSSTTVIRRREAPRSARLDAALAEITSRQRTLDGEPPAPESRRNGAARAERMPARDEAIGPIPPKAVELPRDVAAEAEAAAEADWRLPAGPVARPEFARVRDRFARGPEADNLARLERQLQSLASYMAEAPAREPQPRPAIGDTRRVTLEDEIRAIAPKRAAEPKPPREPEGERIAADAAPRRPGPSLARDPGEGDPRLGRVVEELARNGRMIQSGNFSAAEQAAALDGKIATLTRAVQEIGERIDHLAETTAPDQKTLESLRGSIQELRTRAIGLAGGDGSALTAIRSALDGIVERLDRLPLMEPERYAHAVRQEMTSVGERLIDAVRTEMQRPAAALTARDDSVREAVERLARRLERAEERGHLDPTAAVEAALERFVKRIEPAATPAVLTRLERGILDVLRQIEDGRALANESVEAIAARAVRTTLAALQGAQLDRDDGGALVRELADLRGQSEDTQRRIVDALAGVRDALEKVTDRLADRPITPLRGAIDEAAVAEEPEAVEEDEPETITERARAAAIEAADEAERDGTLAPVFPVADEETFPPREVEPGQERAQLIAAARRALMESEIERSRAERGEELAREAVAIQGANDNVVAGRGVRRFAIGLAAALVLAGSWQVGRILTNRHETATATAAAVPQPAGEQLAAAEAHPDTASAAPAKDDAHAPADTSAATDAASAAPQDTASAASQETASAAPAAAPGAPPAATTAAAAPATTSVTTQAVTASIATEPAVIAAPPATTGQDSAPRPADPAVTASLPAAPLPAANPETVAPAVPMEPAGGSRLMQRAGAGDAPAEYELAERYYDGRGFKRDTAKAADWFGRAARHGLAPAEYRLGALYEKGIGIGKDAAKAREWYERAADHGNVRAMHNLGVLYADGALGRPDFGQAARWFRKAADYGLKDSQYNLGVLYARGLAVKQNLPEAYLWFSLAADQGDKDAAEKRDQLAKKMTDQQLSTAKLAAGTWQAKKAIAAANEVATPPGGWDRAPATARAK
ncbi:MAG TPA: hypothetical protein VHD15_02640 [Hyphomicrobiales bacterium]|nr:hypothetical protein [Hyphomicrobiales bacterium]